VRQYATTHPPTRPSPSLRYRDAPTAPPSLFLVLPSEVVAVSSLPVSENPVACRSRASPRHRSLPCGGGCGRPRFFPPRLPAYLPPTALLPPLKQWRCVGAPGPTHLCCFPYVNYGIAASLLVTPMRTWGPSAVSRTDWPEVRLAVLPPTDDV